MAVPRRTRQALRRPRSRSDWVEETLRYDTSSQLLARTARVDFDKHGRTIHEGDRVVLLIGSANRDPRVFPHPDVYDLDRAHPLPQLASFGFGRHYCLGASLARLEAKVALEELVDAVADYDVDESGISRALGQRPWLRRPADLGAGPLSPGTPSGMTPARLDRPALATWVRELLMAGHLIDRAGMPQLIARFGAEPMRDIAIDEWMGASPVYTRRTQQLLGFAGGRDVETIFKGMQLDVGAPPQFLDFRYRVHDERHGEFWLDHCGALADVEPMGEEFVVAMCHDIEDPTFPATACATDPRAKVEPIHRPPRVPADRHPHCHWTVTIDDADPAAPEPAYALRVAATRAGTLPVTPVDPAGDDEGARRYDGALQADLDLEAFSASTLRALGEEVALQGQLLVISFGFAVADRYGPEAADEITRRQLMGVGPSPPSGCAPPSTCPTTSTGSPPCSTCTRCCGPAPTSTPPSSARPTGWWCASPTARPCTRTRRTRGRRCWVATPRCWPPCCGACTRRSRWSSSTGRDQAPPSP
ncbi:MAG: cytochrome P450 [Acidimicrobiales bacterium]